jgi:hypothetical protein
LTSTKRAPWYIIPANHKWFRNLAVSQIIAETMDEMGLKLPPTHVDIAAIRRKYHAAEREEGLGRKPKEYRRTSRPPLFLVNVRAERSTGVQFCRRMIT